MQNSQPEISIRNESLKEQILGRFLHYFPGGFNDAAYIAGERKDKWKVHLLWQNTFGKKQYSDLLAKGEYAQISSEAVRIGSQTNLLTSLEKNTLCDAVQSEGGARLFAIALYNYLHGQGGNKHHFHTLTRVLETLPHKGASALTWPVQTVFGFIDQPLFHIVVIPGVFQKAAGKYGFEITYGDRPNWDTYQSVRNFAAQVVKDFKILKPFDMIDLQFLISMLGSDTIPTDNDQALMCR